MSLLEMVAFVILFPVWFGIALFVLHIPLLGVKEAKTAGIFYAILALVVTVVSLVVNWPGV